MDAAAMVPGEDQRMRRSLGALVCAFALLMGVHEPAPPLPGHAAFADLLMPFALGTALLVAQPSLSRQPGAWAALCYVAWAAVSGWRHGAGGWKVLGICELVSVA